MQISICDQQSFDSVSQLSLYPNPNPNPNSIPNLNPNSIPNPNPNPHHIGSA